MPAAPQYHRRSSISSRQGLVGRARRQRGLDVPSSADRKPKNSGVEGDNLIKHKRQLSSSSHTIATLVPSFLRAPSSSLPPRPKAWVWPSTPSFPFPSHPFHSLFASSYTPLRGATADLGAGGHGHVVSAVRNRDALPVAVKLIPKHLVPPQSWVRDGTVGGRRVPVEVALLSRLDHKNIVKMIEVFEDDKVVYLVMEKMGTSSKDFETGKDKKTCMDLFDCIDLHVRLPEHQARHLFSQIMSAIAYLHALGIAHRDIKDENVLVDMSLSHAKIIDFGSAGIARGKRERGKRDDSEGVNDDEDLFDWYDGSAAYAAPEILLGKVYKGRPSDIWSLGILLVRYLRLRTRLHNYVLN
ncbi:hypothetical protein HK104_010992 [Borealophlyctis nickersoniae]|nr:hypothetical protein HK104_010992 [Borealophlyctis nickersoniae]